jgi:hypothetical protein
MSRGKLGFVNENFLPIWGATVCVWGGGPIRFLKFRVNRKTSYLVPGTTCVFLFFFSMVVPGCKCQKKI